MARIKKIKAKDLIIKRGGRPTKFDAKYCSMLVKHMGQGLGFESFAAVVGVDKDTLYRWKTPDNSGYQPIFYEAWKDAKAKELLFFEKMAVEVAQGARNATATGMIIWLMINKFPRLYKQRREDLPTQDDE